MQGFLDTPLIEHSDGSSSSPHKREPTPSFPLSRYPRPEVAPPQHTSQNQIIWIEPDRWHHLSASQKWMAATGRDWKSRNHWICEMQLHVEKPLSWNWIQLDRITCYNKHGSWRKDSIWIIPNSLRTGSNKQVNEKHGHISLDVEELLGIVGHKVRWTVCGQQ